MDTCRSCGSPLGRPFLNLGNSPVSNAYLSEKDVHLPETYYPLEVYQCPGCTLIQIDEYERPEHIFNEDYAYFSSYSQTWLDQCKTYADTITDRLSLTERSTIVEIGSNDGYLLQYFKGKGIPAVGIEPSRSVAERAISMGVPTDITFFNTAYAGTTKLQPDLVIANNVLAHNPNLNDFVGGIAKILADTGTVTIEVPHVLRLIEDTLFDTIYHEHYSYFSLYALHDLLGTHGLEVYDVEEIPSQGGSLRVYAKHREDTTKKISWSVRAVMTKERDAGLHSPATYLRFRKTVELKKRRLLECLIKVRDEGRSVVGYGAPAKGNTLLNYCGIRADFLEYTVDANPAKQGKYLPGTHIPVKTPDQIRVDEPDYILILPWNIKDEIIQQLSYVQGWGGKFIIPLPDIQVVNA